VNARALPRQADIEALLAELRAKEQESDAPATLKQLPTFTS